MAMAACMTRDERVFIVERIPRFIEQLMGENN